MAEGLNVTTGIVPPTDRVGRILFDADWDFNVGGIVFWGRGVRHDCRTAYVRLVEGVGGMDADTGDTDANLFLADYNHTLRNGIDISVHLYGLSLPDEITNNVLTTPSLLSGFSGPQVWFGVTAQKPFGDLSIDGTFLGNRAEFHLAVGIFRAAEERRASKRMRKEISGTIRATVGG